MSFNVPMSKCIFGIVLLSASHFDLLETPLRQVDVTSTKIAAKRDMLKAESRGEGSDFGSVIGRDILHNLDLPVVLLITDRRVSVTRNFFISLCDRRWNIMRV